jgi:hypothetical protein
LEKNDEVIRHIGPNLDQAFDPWAGLEHTDLAYERIGLGIPAQ